MKQHLESKHRVHLIKSVEEEMFSFVCSVYDTSYGSKRGLGDSRRSSKSCFLWSANLSLSSSFSCCQPVYIRAFRDVALR